MTNGNGNGNNKNRSLVRTTVTSVAAILAILLGIYACIKPSLMIADKNEVAIRELQRDLNLHRAEENIKWIEIYQRISVLERQEKDMK